MNYMSTAILLAALTALLVGLGYLLGGGVAPRQPSSLLSRRIS